MEGIIVKNILLIFPPTIIAVITYAKSESTKYFSTLTYLSYGIKISATIINAENSTAVTTKGTSGNIILIEADMAPKSAPILIVLAIISRLDIG